MTYQVNEAGPHEQPSYPPTGLLPRYIINRNPWDTDWAFSDLFRHLVTGAVCIWWINSHTLSAWEGRGFVQLFSCRTLSVSGLLVESKAQHCRVFP